MDEEGELHELAAVGGKLGAAVEDGRADDHLVPSARQVQPDCADGQPLEGAALRGERTLWGNQRGTNGDRNAAKGAPGILVGERVVDAEGPEGLVAEAGE